MAENTICLRYDKTAEAAARFYAETFSDSAVGAIHRAPSDYPSGKNGRFFASLLTQTSVTSAMTNARRWPITKHPQSPLKSDTPR
jgi:predicted 3-demethylubiquinone-9 3-methyltransferase (glyoxalase superfamily)